MFATHPTNHRHRVSRPLHSVALLGLALLIVGCTKSQPSQSRQAYFIKVKDGHVVFNVGKLDIVFEGMEPKAGLQSTGWLTVPNRGASGNGMQSANGVTVKQSWKDGVNTISVNDFSFDLIASHHATVSGNRTNEFSRASQIKIGDQSFSIDESKTIYVLADGNISLTAAAERVSDDSYRVTVKEGPADILSIVVEFESFEGKQMAFGIGESMERIGGFGAHTPQKKTTFTAKGRLVDNGDSEGQSLEVVLEYTPQSKTMPNQNSTAKYAVDDGKSVSDVLSFNGKSGMYKPGEPLVLGKIVGKGGKTHTIILHVTKKRETSDEGQ